VFCLGQKSDNKHRPLLVELGSEIDSLLSAAPCLYLSNAFKQVYIAIDMTKVERERRKKVVAELKRRRSSGESNLTIRNGVIISCRPHPDTNSTARTSAQAAKGPPGQSNQSS